MSRSDDARAPRPPTRHATTTRDGWRIAVYHRPPTEAAHATPVVLCHGMGSNRYNLDGPGRTSLARYLCARGYDVWLVELRGAGRSKRRLRLPPVPYAWNFEDHVSHDVPAALALVRELTRSERVLWVGHSLGGMVAYASLMTQAGASFAGVVTLASPGMTDIGHESLDRWLRLRRALRLLPARIPARLGARLSAPFAGVISSVFSDLVRDWFWHPDNFDVDVARFMMCHGVEDLPRALIEEFAGWYETRRMSDRYDLWTFADHLDRIRAPVFVIGGSRDRLTPPEDLERLVRGIGSDDKRLFIAGHAGGLAHEYSHVDLVLGRHAPDEIYPRVAEWLDAHKA